MPQRARLARATKSRAAPYVPAPERICTLLRMLRHPGRKGLSCIFYRLRPAKYKAGATPQIEGWCDSATEHLVAPISHMCHKRQFGCDGAHQTVWYQTSTEQQQQLYLVFVKSDLLESARWVVRSAFSKRSPVILISADECAAARPWFGMGRLTRNSRGVSLPHLRKKCTDPVSTPTAACWLAANLRTYS